MAVPPFRPPVYQPLHGPDWDRPAGNREYRVTQTFDHVNAAISPYPHHALDLGNGTSGDALFAPAAGTIVAEGWLQEPWSQPATQAQATTWHSPYPSGWGGIMVVIDHGDGWYTALAHMSRTIVNAGQKVAAGQQVGNLGGTGAAAGVAHCHWDLYRTVDGKRVKVDAWPLLEQNYVAPLPDTATSGGTEPMTTVTIATFPPRVVHFKAGTTYQAWSPSESKPVKSATPTRDTWAHADASVQVTHDPQRVPNGWFYRMSDGYFDGLLVFQRDVTIDPAPAAPSNQDAIDAAVKAAVTPLYGRIDGIKAKAAAFAKDIADD